MTESQNYICPSCGGALQYSPRQKSLVCNHCDSRFDYDELSALSTFSEYVKRCSEDLKNRSLADIPSEEFKNVIDIERGNLTVYTCSSCGAELTTDKSTAVTCCPYCGNNNILPGRLDGIHQPDFVIPFVIDKGEAQSRLNEFYKSRKLLPSDFINDDRTDTLQGVYLPYWLYTGTQLATGSFEGTTTSRFKATKLPYTKKDYYYAYRLGSFKFNNVPTKASSKIPDRYLEAIEPFDFEQLEPFSYGCLSGYLSDRYDTNALVCQPRAEQRMETTSFEQLTNFVKNDFDFVVPLSIESDTGIDKADYALLPVWIHHTIFKDTHYYTIMNGQTGKITADLPIGKKKLAKHFGLTFAIAFITAFFIFALT